MNNQIFKVGLRDLINNFNICVISEPFLREKNATLFLFRFPKLLDPIISVKSICTEMPAQLGVVVVVATRLQPNQSFATSGPEPVRIPGAPAIPDQKTNKRPNCFPFPICGVSFCVFPHFDFSGQNFSIFTMSFFFFLGRRYPKVGTIRK